MTASPSLEKEIRDVAKVFSGIESLHEYSALLHRWADEVSRLILLSSQPFECSAFVRDVRENAARLRKLYRLSTAAAIHEAFETRARSIE